MVESATNPEVYTPVDCKMIFLLYSILILMIFGVIFLIFVCAEKSSRRAIVLQVEVIVLKNSYLILNSNHNKHSTQGVEWNPSHHDASCRARPGY